MAGGARDLAPVQRQAALAAGYVPAKLPGAHAEITALQHAAQNGSRPTAMGVSRATCPACATVLEQSGGTLTSPTAVIGKCGHVDA